MTAQTRNAARNALLAYAIGMTAVVASGAGVLGAMAIDKYVLQAQAVELAPDVVGIPARAFDSAYSDGVAVVQEQCYLALAEVESSMTEEEAELIPAEIWRSAYQRCLLDNNATL